MTLVTMLFLSAYFEKGYYAHSMKPSKFKEYQEMERIIKATVSQQSYFSLPWKKLMMPNGTVTIMESRSGLKYLNHASDSIWKLSKYKNILTYVRSKAVNKVKLSRILDNTEITNEHSQGTFGQKSWFQVSFANFQSPLILISIIFTCLD